MFELGLDAAHLHFGLGALLAAFGLNLQHLVERLDKRLVSLLQRFDIDDAALRFLCHLDGGGVQHFGILLQ